MRCFRVLEAGSPRARSQQDGFLLKLGGYLCCVSPSIWWFASNFWRSLAYGSCVAYLLCPLTLHSAPVGLLLFSHVCLLHGTMIPVRARTTFPYSSHTVHLKDYHTYGWHRRKAFASVRIVRTVTKHTSLVCAACACLCPASPVQGGSSHVRIGAPYSSMTFSYPNTSAMTLFPNKISLWSTRGVVTSTHEFGSRGAQINS